MPVTYKIATPADERLFETVAEDLFDRPVSKKFLREFLTDDRHHMAIAIADDMIVGFVSGVHYIHPDKPPELWINEVGVSETWQKQGIAKALMSLMLAHGRQLNCEEAWVLTDGDNVAANALYKSLNSQTDKVIYHTYSLT